MLQDVDVSAVLSHPLTLIVAAIIGFFLKDLFFQVKQGSDNKHEIETLKQRVTALEASKTEWTNEVSELKVAIARLEEQVKNLVTTIREQKNG